MGLEATTKGFDYGVYDVDATGLAGRKVMIIYDGTAGAGRHYIAAAVYLREMGLLVSMVGPPDASDLGRHFEVSYVSTSPSTSEILSAESVIKATTENDLDELEKVLQAETEPYKAGNINVICQAIKGFEPELILTSTRTLVTALTVGNALSIPVLPLALQEPTWSLSDALEPAWAKMKESSIAQLLSKELGAFGSTFEQSLGSSSPASHFWPSVSQVKALAGQKPEFPYLTMFASEMYQQGCTLPDTLPYPTKAKTSKSKVFALGDFRLDLERESGLDVDRDEALRLNRWMQNVFCSSVKIRSIIYVSFGPVICNSMKYMTGLVLRALKQSNWYAIVDASSGMTLSQISEDPDASELTSFCESHVFFVHRVPSSRFLTRCSIWLYDGNTSMLDRTFDLNATSVVTPILGRQFTNAEMVEKLELGSALPPMKSLTVAQLAEKLQSYKVDHQPFWPNCYAQQRSFNSAQICKFRLAKHLRDIWEKNIKNEQLIKDMDDLKAQKDRSIRCCGSARRVQP